MGNEQSIETKVAVLERDMEDMREFKRSLPPILMKLEQACNDLRVAMAPGLVAQVAMNGHSDNGHVTHEPEKSKLARWIETLDGKLVSFYALVSLFGIDKGLEIIKALIGP